MGIPDIPDNCITVRQLAVTLPTLITWKGTPTRVKKNLFSLNEEMGFTEDELRQMVMLCPMILKTPDDKVSGGLDILISKMFL